MAAASQKKHLKLLPSLTCLYHWWPLGAAESQFEVKEKHFTCKKGKYFSLIFPHRICFLPVHSLTRKSFCLMENFWPQIVFFFFFTFMGKASVSYFLWTCFPRVEKTGSLSSPLLRLCRLSAYFASAVLMKWELGAVVRNVQQFAFSRSLNPPVVFFVPSQNPCRMFMGPLFCKQPRWHWRQLWFVAASAKRKWLKHQTAILDFPCLGPTCPLFLDHLQNSS